MRRGTDSIETQAAPVSERGINKAWFFAVLSLGMFSTQNAVFMLPPLLVEISTDLEISVPVAGQLATATFAAWAVSLLTVGPLSDSFGRRPVILAGLLVLVAAVLASAFAPNIEVFLVLRVLIGLAAGTLPPTSVGVLSDVISPERRAQAVSGILAVGVLTTAVSVPVVAVLADWQGWRFTFVISGLLLASAFVANWVWFPRDSRERIRKLSFFSRYGSLLSLGYFRAAVAVGLSQRIAYWTIVSYYAAYLIKTYGLNVGFAALPLWIVAVAQVIGNYAGGFVAAKGYRAALLGATSAAGGICAFLCFSFDFQLWVSVALATAGTGLLSITMATLVAASTEYSGESKATGASIMGLSNQSAGALGAAVSGGILASVGFEGIGYLCLAVTLASALLAGVFGRHLRIGVG